MLLADQLMIIQGRRDEAVEHLEHAVSLLADRPPSHSKARVLAGRAQSHLAFDEAEFAVAAARVALAMADELELDEFRAHALSTLGFSRVMTGDLGGLDDLRTSVELARVANSPQAARGLNLLASLTAELGDLPRAFGLYGESRREAERFGDALVLRWLDVERMYELWWTGDWDAALAAGSDLLSVTEDGPAWFNELDVVLVRAKVGLAREGAAAALDEAERALELAREIGAPQILFPVLAFEAHALAAASRLEEAGAAADELLRLWLDDGRGQSLGGFWLADLAFALATLGRGDLASVAGRARTPTRWLEATTAAGGGDWSRAAGIFAAIGSLPDEALARVRAASELTTADRSAEAEEERRRARAFHREVGADAYTLVDQA